MNDTELIQRGEGLFTEGRWRKQSIAEILALKTRIELELIQSHMAQKPVLRDEVGCVCVAREVTHIKRHPDVESFGEAPRSAEQENSHYIVSSTGYLGFQLFPIDQTCEHALN